MKIFNQFTLLLLFATTFNSIHAMTEPDRSHAIHTENYWREKLPKLFKVFIVEKDPQQFVDYLNSADSKSNNFSTDLSKLNFYCLHAAEYKDTKNFFRIINDNHHSLWSDSLSSSMDAALFLIQHGVDVNKPIYNIHLDPCFNYLTLNLNYRFTPLMIAANCSDIKLTKALLKAGADVNKLDSTGKSALDYAVMRYEDDPTYPQNLLIQAFDSLHIPTMHQALQEANKLGLKGEVGIIVTLKAAIDRKSKQLMNSSDANAISSSLATQEPTTTTNSSDETDEDEWSWLNKWPEDKK